MYEFNVQIGYFDIKRLPVSKIHFIFGYFFIQR